MKLTTWTGTNSRKDRKPKSSPVFQNSATTADTKSAAATETTRTKRYVAFARAMKFPLRRRAQVCKPANGSSHPAAKRHSPQVKDKFDVFWIRLSVFRSILRIFGFPVI